MDPPSLREGAVLRGKYRVERVLGEGGMGQVVAARHLRLDQRVAIKVLRADSLAKPELVERFAREARAAAKIKSEHVVRILDVDDHDDGAPFIVMEYLEGHDLAEVIRKDGALDPGRAVDHVLEACEALAEAHAIGLVHRDVKPANLFLTTRTDGEPMIKLLDFGISKIVASEDNDLSLTERATVLGSPYYMSPEQVRCAKDVDARTDIWSLGVVLYQLLSTNLPFRGPTTTAVCACIAADAPEPLPDGVPKELGAAVVRCLEKDPAKRFATVAELARAIAPFAASDLAAKIPDRLARVLSSGKALAPTVPGPREPAPPQPAGRVTAALDDAPPEQSRSSTHQGHSVRAQPPARAPRFWALGVLAIGVATAAWLSLRPSPKIAAPAPSSPPPPPTAIASEPSNVDAAVASAPAPAPSRSPDVPPRAPAPKRPPAGSAPRTGLEVDIK